MSPAMKVKAYSAHTGLLSRRILNVHLLLPSSIWTTVGTHPVNHYLFCLVYLPLRSHPGIRIQMQMLQGVSQWSEVLYCIVAAYQHFLRQKKKQSTRKSSRPFVPL